MFDASPNEKPLKSSEINCDGSINYNSDRVPSIGSSRDLVPDYGGHPLSVY